MVAAFWASDFDCHSGFTGKLRRNLDERLGDEHRHRVQVAGIGPQAEPLGFERDRPAAAEGIEYRRRVLGQEGIHDLRPGLHQHDLPGGRAIAGSRPLGMLLPLLVAEDDAVFGQFAKFDLAGRHAAGDFGARGIDDAGIVRVLPLDQLLDEVEELRPLDAGAVYIDCAIGLAVGGIAVGIID
jgi:hypothetical protein